MKVQGLVHKYGSHVDTDVIIPARYLNTSDEKELASHCMEDIDKDFVKTVKSGDIIVADENFGCGSSREHAPIAIKASGISCVIAASFARIFYRNSINIGLPILECPAASADIKNGDEVSVDFDSGVITNVTTGKEYKAEPFPEFIQNIIKKGGLLKAAVKPQLILKLDNEFISMTDTSGKEVARIDFPSIPGGVVDIRRTFVDESMRGKGIAAQLMKTVADKVRKEGKKVRPSCSYAVKWFGEHKDYNDILE